MSSKEDFELEFLMKEYSQVRDDDRHNSTVTATAFGVALAGAAALANALEKSFLPNAAYALAPLLLLSVLLFMLDMGARASVRVFYLRALERQLMEKLSISLPLNPHTGPQSIPMPSYIHLMQSLESQSTGSFKRLWYVLYGIVVVITVGIVVLYIAKIRDDLPLTALAIFMYLCFLPLIVRCVWLESVAGDRLWSDVVADLRAPAVPNTCSNFQICKDAVERVTAEIGPAADRRRQLDERSLAAAFVPLGLRAASFSWLDGAT